MQETIELELPISKSVVEIRNYTTRDDDERAEAVLYAGVEAEASSKSGEANGDDAKIKFPIANIMASKKAYIPRLVKSIDGDTTNIALRLKDLRSEDYAAVEAAVEKIIEEHSPKAKKA